ncbi:hypothetical protein [Leeuwenhoekiella marinoflava]|uniref:Subunit length determinant protein n=2 Tax=Leeuwenhoekiella marinoflava TaxID=988 RepID=A0A4Q0PQR0_9FLAO|nr:hypothetical protein [Leeuwenhoekiella marinoflava]RXG32959.1 hypothetical protein DSL99_50 [Leeuwenhoekiella marinoflava]SHE33459.1 hypothetical protein SAMN02745246_00109 [Leeuwenhoekiella marinoflava DSM 3653]
MSQDKNQDIDLFDLFRGMRNLFKKCLIYAYRFGRFIVRKALIIIGLIILGVVVGYGLSKLIKPLQTAEILVAPNVKSTAYLYGKVEQIEKSLKNENHKFSTDFSTENLKKIAVEPIEDITSVLKNLEDLPQDIIPRISENYSDKSAFYDKPLYAPAYDLHRIVLVASDSLVDLDAVMAYLESNTFLQQKRIAAVSSMKKEIEANNFSIRQIDSVLTNVSAALKQGNTSLNVLANNENSSTSAILNSKTELLLNNRILEQKVTKLDAVFKVYSKSAWVEKISLRSVLVLIIPVLLVFLFVCYHALNRFKKRFKNEL